MNSFREVSFFQSVKKIFLYLVMFLLVGFITTSPVMALTEKQLFIYGQNNILYYIPNGKDDDCYSDDNLKGDSDGSDVYLIGDSISVNSQAQIKNVLPNITIDAISGTYFSQDSDFGPGGTNRIKSIGNQNILVFAMGTNGGINQMVPDDTEKFFAAMDGRDVKVILMTIFYNGYSTEQMNNTNTLVKSLASKYDNISYMDWNAAVSGSPSQYIVSDGVHPTAAGQKKFAELIKASVDKVSTIGSPSVPGTGDYSKVLTAKNADEYVFNVPNYSEWDAWWPDNDNGRIAHVLEHYGDLAYQLGDAIGAPWVAIIVQMRYEDSRSVCGANNFWGNGCPAGSGPGDASIQGKNLGEGFMQYGQTLTNGFHNQAIGITDPIEYLEKLGPTWVQGNVNGPGYGSIDGMRQSVRALLAFIETQEGQAIVKEFGNYHGTTGTGGKSSVCTDDDDPDDGDTTIVDIDGENWAFPIADAAKDNYLQPNGVNGESVLSWLPCNNPGGCHHDSVAFDLGINMNKVPGAKAYTAASAAAEFDEPGFNNLRDMMFYSMGATVVAPADGVITRYKGSFITTGVPAAWEEKCASIIMKTNSGIVLYMAHIADDEMVSTGQTVKAGQPIGHIGSPYCAQTTQSHLHINIVEGADPYSIIPLMNKLYDALPESITR